ncbi:MAG: hypothetical protein PHF24_09325, partial [Syntrophomonas sp.]|nr:hypothetical protein [Syntrophomonas sp.]
NDPRYKEIHSLVRRPGNLHKAKLVEHIIDFDNLDKMNLDVKIDDIFCTLGTTIKKASSREKFYRVYFTYVVELARLAKTLGDRSFLVVSALGANPQSRIFYNRVKGEMEEAVKEVPLKTIYIFRPSVLAGSRKEARWGEIAAASLLRVLAPVMVGPLRKYRVTNASHLAWAMLRAAKECPAGVNTVEADAIFEMVQMK